MCVCQREREQGFEREFERKFVIEFERQKGRRHYTFENIKIFTLFLERERKREREILWK